jgi:hypothetical protein
MSFDPIQWAILVGVFALAGLAKGVGENLLRTGEKRHYSPW